MRLKKMTNVQIITIGFLLLALIGACLLSLPIASRDRTWTPFLPSLFTSVSASCVTGLIVVDTATHWSLFGQIVIITLIQIGGLGFITIATAFLSFMRKGLGLKSRALMAESVNTGRIAGLRGYVRYIVKGAILIESAGTVLLAIPFIREFGVWKGIYYGVFHSISAFCNAGFDLMGVKEPFSSLVSYCDRAYINIVFILLITVGGIGFQVWEDVRKYRWRLKRYSLHSKLVLVVSAVLTFGGAFAYYVFERNALFADVGVGEALLSALFQSVTCRTAGFNTVDLSKLSDPSALLSCFLMFIGGSPGSTAGGIKTTTLAIMFIYLVSSLRSSAGEPQLFGRSLDPAGLRKASGVVCFNFSLVMIASFVISAYGLPLTQVLFEAFSAMGTVGMSMGITRELPNIGLVLIMLLMFCGRVGSVTLASALLEKRVRPKVQYPKEDINIG
ncbi:MAG: Trk family potassium uptake protein [Clostridia bacterium]|nr:Trk family potassium uptake protein [Clostridia bacterium]